MPLRCSLQMALPAWARWPSPQISAHRGLALCPTPLELPRVPCTTALGASAAQTCILQRDLAGVGFSFSPAFVTLSNHWDPNHPSLLTTHQHPSQVNFYLQDASRLSVVLPIPLAPAPQVKHGTVGRHLLQQWLFLPLVSLHLGPSLAELPQ